MRNKRREEMKIEMSVGPQTNREMFPVTKHLILVEAANWQTCSSSRFARYICHIPG